MINETTPETVDAATQMRKALAKHFSREKLEEIVKSLPPDAQERIRKIRAPKPVIRKIRITTRRTKKKP